MDCPANCRLTIEEWGARESVREREPTPSQDADAICAVSVAKIPKSATSIFHWDDGGYTRTQNDALLCVYIYGSICCAEASYSSLGAPYHFFSYKRVPLFALFPYNHNIDLLPACKEVGKLALAKVDVGPWEERIKTCSYLFYGRMCKKENGLLFRVHSSRTEWYVGKCRWSIWMQILTLNWFTLLPEQANFVIF
jgi:hypothetical protein